MRYFILLFHINQWKPSKYFTLTVHLILDQPRFKSHTACSIGPRRSRQRGPHGAWNEASAHRLQTRVHFFLCLGIFGHRVVTTTGVWRGGWRCRARGPVAGGPPLPSMEPLPGHVAAGGPRGSLTPTPPLSVRRAPADRTLPGAAWGGAAPARAQWTSATAAACASLFPCLQPWHLVCGPQRPHLRMDVMQVFS